MTTPAWRVFLPPTTRPGSRTVLCDPPDFALAEELARRGYRLLILHDGGFDVAQLRDTLRQHGLGSQLMGAHECPTGRAPSLATSFYDLWLCGGAPRWLDQACRCLQKGAPILWLSGHPEPALPQATRRVEGLPDGVEGLQTL